MEADEAAYEIYHPEHVQAFAEVRYYLSKLNMAADLIQVVYIQQSTGICRSKTLFEQT